VVLVFGPSGEELRAAYHSGYQLLANVVGERSEMTAAGDPRWTSTLSRAARGEKRLDNETKNWSDLVEHYGGSQADAIQQIEAEWMTWLKLDPTRLPAAILIRVSSSPVAPEASWLEI